MYQAVIFDLDGTLIDNTEQIFESYKSSVLLLDLEYPGDPSLRSMIGLSMSSMLESLKVPDHLQEKFKDLYVIELSKRGASLFPGIRSMLEQLHSLVPLGIVTSKLSSTTTHVLEELKLGKFFDFIITSGDVTHTKPDPEGLILACQELQMKPSKKIVYVGDREHDMDAAYRAEISGIAVNWGVDKLSSNQYKSVQSVQFVQSVGELLAILIKKY